MRKPEDLSLNAVLAEQGLTTRPASGTYRKDILGPGGEVLFTGDAQAVWDWLRGECTGCGHVPLACCCSLEEHHGE